MKGKYKQEDSNSILVLVKHPFSLWQLPCGPTTMAVPSHATLYTCPHSSYVSRSLSTLFSIKPWKHTTFIGISCSSFFIFCFCDGNLKPFIEVEQARLDELLSKLLDYFLYMWHAPFEVYQTITVCWLQNYKCLLV